MWSPVTKNIIEKNIEWCNDILSLRPDCLRFWEYIRIPPEKWIEQTVGNDGGGFWVVAILGKRVIYYNDIEEGFNLSPFTKYGEINEYRPGQLELHEMIESLYKEIIKQKK